MHYNYVDIEKETNVIEHTDGNWTARVIGTFKTE